jgi:hypothetical protein
MAPVQDPKVRVKKTSVLFDNDSVVQDYVAWGATAPSLASGVVRLA